MHIKKSAKTALSLSFSLALAVNATFIGASAFSSSAAETTDSLTPVTISAPSTQPLSTTTVNSANTTTTSTAPSNYTTTTTTAPIDPTKPQSGTTVSVPLSGTYSLKLNVADIVSHENITGLNCELFNLDTKEVIASWNTSDEPVKSFENLKYSFNSPTSLTGNIRYAIRITNLPDNYVFFYGKSREFYGISGFGLEEFAKGSDLTCTAFLENTDPDAPKVTYTTSPVNDSTTTTTTTTTTAANANNSDSTTTATNSTTTTTTTTNSANTTTTTTAPIDPTKPQSDTTVSVPLSGTYSLKLNVADIVSHENITGLNCELFNLDTKEVIASWNTSDEPVKSFENLKYSFNSPTSLTGNIRYAIRITNLPDNYVFFYGKDREFYGISGFGLEEFAKGSDLTCTAFLENTDPDAPKVTYTTSPVNDSTTTTTTTTTTAATSNTSTLPQTGYPLSTADVAAAACAMIGIGSVLTASSRKSKKHSD